MELREGAIYRTPDGRLYKAEFAPPSAWVLEYCRASKVRPLSLQQSMELASMNLWMEKGDNRLVRVVIGNTECQPPDRDDEFYKWWHENAASDGVSLVALRKREQDTGWTVDDLEEIEQK